MLGLDRLTARHQRDVSLDGALNQQDRSFHLRRGLRDRELDVLEIGDTQAARALVAGDRGEFLDRALGKADDNGAE